MKGVIAWALVIALVPGLALAESPPEVAAAAGERSGDAFVARLASTGRAFSPTFSADGQTVGLVSDLGGVVNVVALFVVPDEAAKFFDAFGRIHRSRERT